jgi:threonine/homoserine/homoserine lactone efflux protein
MVDILPPTPLLTAFLAASLVLALTPGPGVLYIVARSLAQGRRAGLASVAGVALGNLGNAVAAGLGLAALFEVSDLAFTLVKYAGAAYLVYLGIRALTAPAAVPEAGPTPLQPVARVFRDGVLVALLNPKTTVFFAAFLPQFMTPGSPPPVQPLMLGALFVLIAGCTDALYALAAGSLGRAIGRYRAARTAGRRLAGLTFIGLGLLSLAGGPRTPRAT